MIKIVDTTLRDAHQSLIATRLTTEEVITVAKHLDKVGFYSLEVWGGATFDVSYKFLNEDPWERLKLLKKNITNTKLQMLLRGQNLVGYRPYGNDTVEKFISKSAENGIDIFRIFDALNDFRNLHTSIKAIIKSKAHCQIALAYTLSPYHNNEYYLNLAIEAEKLGANSICIKDMSGILTPTNAEILILSLKDKISIPVNLHSHDISGIISATYYKAIESKVDIIDTALSPFSSGNSQPPTESFVHLLHQIYPNKKYNLIELEIARDKLSKIRKKYINNGLLNIDSLTPYPGIISTQVPGGMLSNLFNQLKEQNQDHKFHQVLEEISHVRKDFGFPPLVTPISQIVGVQATLNVILNERYKIIPNEAKDYLFGKYGKIVGKVDDDLLKKIGLKRYNSNLNFDFDEFTSLRNKLDNSLYSDENLLSSIIIGQSYKLLPDLIDQKYIKERNYKNDIRFFESDEIFIFSPLDSKVIDTFFLTNQFFMENDILIKLLTVDNELINILAPCDGKILQTFCIKDNFIQRNTPVFKFLKKK
jgi:oxaloacetate decarboxylase alpha subunit